MTKTEIEVIKSNHNDGFRLHSILVDPSHALVIIQAKQGWQLHPFYDNPLIKHTDLSLKSSVLKALHSQGDSLKPQQDKIAASFDDKRDEHGVLSNDDLDAMSQMEFVTYGVWSLPSPFSDSIMAYCADGMSKLRSHDAMDYYQQIIKAE
tara:strand:- start:454 stop:903 length:450 start_codon:yes stop_codon:yes gene_type:complete